VAESEPDTLEADLSAYLDGELSEERTAQVQAALKKSAEARRLLEQLRTTVRALNALPRIAAPPELADELRQAAERRLSRPQPRRSGVPHILRVYGSWTAAAAGILLAFAAGRLSVEMPHTRSATTRVEANRAGEEAGDTPVPAAVLSGQGHARQAPAQSTTAADPLVAGRPAQAGEAGLELAGAGGKADRITNATPLPEEQGTAPLPAQVLETLAAAPDQSQGRAREAFHIVVQTRTPEQFAASIATVEAWARETSDGSDRQVRAVSPSALPEREQLPGRVAQSAQYSALISAAGRKLDELIVHLESGNPDGIVVACRPSDVAVTRQLFESISLAQAAERRATGEPRLSQTGRAREHEGELPVAAALQQPEAREDKALGFARPDRRGATATPSPTAIGRPLPQANAAADPATRPSPERDIPAHQASRDSSSGPGAGRAQVRAAQRTLTSRIAERLRDSLQTWLDLADEASAPTSEAELRPVPVRVTVLPPAAEEVTSVAPSTSPATHPAP
jgi:hypothetical protein